MPSGRWRTSSTSATASAEGGPERWQSQSPSRKRHEDAFRHEIRRPGSLFPGFLWRLAGLRRADRPRHSLSTTAQAD